MVSHYRVLETLGVGGMGVVYKAEDTRLERFVALKFISGEAASDGHAIGRFQREARAASALSHANICTIHDIGERDGRFFIVMEHLVGETLRQRLSKGALDLGAVLMLGIEIADGLDAAHTAGVVHRDIKPANIFITDSRHAKILDFGLAQLTAPAFGDEPLTEVGATLGTADYMAPEQALGLPVDARADLFSFGVMLSEMATGVRPRSGSRVTVARLPALDALIARCLEHDRDRRVQQAADIRAELQRLKGEAERPVAAGSSPRPVARWVV
ncbi:MAG: serine/threonine-protein kinase, partial [Vicinamibacterales bacterium]